MKNFYTLKTLLVAFVLSCFAATASAESITFDFAANEWGLPLSSNEEGMADVGNITAPIVKDGVSLTFDQGGASTHPRMWNSGGKGQLRLYGKNNAGNTMTVSAPDGHKITKVVFEANNSSLSVNGVAVSNKSWSGEVESVVFVVTANIQITTITVTLDEEDTDEPEVNPGLPEYTSIAAMKAAATAKGEEMAYKFDGLLVTGVAQKGKNYSVYVTDGTEGMLFYGANTPNVKKGDKISGTLTGTLTLYSTLTEISGADYTGVSVTGSDNAVTPVAATLVDVKDNTTKTYENMFVRLEGISFAADALSSSNITMLDESDNELVLRDNFGVLGDFIFDTAKTYNVTAVVAYYNGTPQLYPLSAADVEVVTNLLPAATAWDADEVVIGADEDWTVENALTTASDGAKTFTSSDESVATVAEDGSVTVKGFGHTTITAETAETAVYQGSKVSFELYVIEGKGTLEAPYTIADAVYFNDKAEGKVWVKGTIGGTYVGNKFNANAEEAVATNLAIGTAEQNLPVQLPAGDVRTALNLKDNPDNLGKTVWLYGTLETYFTVAGVKNVTDYSFDGESGVTAIDAVKAEKATDAAAYGIDGRRVQLPTGGLYVVNGKKVFVK